MRGRAKGDKGGSDEDGRGNCKSGGDEGGMERGKGRSDSLPVQ